MEIILHNTLQHIVEFALEHKIALAALIGGIFPSFIWMLFWLREDECDELPDPKNNRTLLCRPEPKSLLLITFILGGLMVPIAFVLQRGFVMLTGATGILLLGVWATIEETLKYGIYRWIDAQSKYIDEPADPLVYLSITALGFSAFENTIFLYHSLTSQTITEAIIGQNMRIIGASLLHVLASGVIGLFLGYAFFQPKSIQRIVAIIGLIFASLLHTLFNYFIISNSGAYTLHVFAVVWLFGAIFLALIERLRYLTSAAQNNQISQ